MKGRDIRILVVDDDDNLRRVICAVIAGVTGQLPLDAHCGAAAIESAATDPPDLVMLDLGLPDTKGYEVCRHMRDELGLEHARVWFMTGDEREIREGMVEDCAASGLLMKPFRAEQIRAIVRESMEVNG